jgi:tetratricopeptide (TPR) repeat protein
MCVYCIVCRCLWELHSTITTGSRLSIAIGAKDREDFQHTLRNDFRSIIKSVCSIDVENSQAYFAADRDKILAAVLATDGGCRSVNNEIIGQMRQWLRQSACDAISPIYNDDEALGLLPENELIDVFCDAHVYALLVHEHGDIMLALELYRKVLSKKEIFLGHDHLETAKTLNNMATCLDDLQTREEAVLILDRVLTVYNKEYNENSQQNLSVLANKAGLLKNLNRDDEAWEILMNILPLQEELLGVDHYEVMSTIFTIAMILNKRGEIKEALKYYNRRIVSLERIEGSTHIDVLNTKRAVAGMLSKNSETRVESFLIFK